MFDEDDVFDELEKEGLPEDARFKGFEADSMEGLTQELNQFKDTHEVYYTDFSTYTDVSGSLDYHRGVYEPTSSTCYSCLVVYGEEE